MIFQKSSLLLLAAFTVLALAACEDGYYPDDNASAQSMPPGIVNDASGYPQLSMTPPPAPRYEDKGFNPDPLHMTWQPGYWDYGGSGYSWVSGKYISKPNFTAVWAPDHWIRHTYGWAFVPGYWQ